MAEATAPATVGDPSAALGDPSAADPIDPEVPQPARPVAPGIQVPVPLEGVDRYRVHDAFGQLVTRGRVVDDRQTLSPHGGSTSRRQQRRLVDLHDERGAGAEHGVQLRGCARQWTVGVRPG
jgi:hypothetical protein